MAVIFSDHALRQISERNLSQSEITETIDKPDKFILQSPQRYRAIRKVRKNNKNYLLIVIYDKINSTQKVITAFLTTKFKKYL